MDSLNIQLIPTPIFYLGRHGIVRFVPDLPFGSATTIISATVQTNQFDAIYDAAGSGSGIASALYIVPDTETAADAANSAASIVSAASTGTIWQRDVAESPANCAHSIVSAVVYAAFPENILDTAGSAVSIVAATIMNSTQYALTDGTALNVNFAHGLAAAPAFLRAVLLCTANDSASGAVVGQELSVDQFFDSFDYNMVFGYGANASHIFLNYSGNGGGTCMCVWTASARDVSSFTNFSLKIYWQ